MGQQPLRLLLVEDNEGDAVLIEEQLSHQRAGLMALERCSTLAVCLERLAAGGIDLVLLDLGLPDSVGLQTLKAVQGAHPNVAMIVLTDLDDDDVAVAAVQSGAQDYLVKGRIDGEMLARAARHAVERKRVEKSLRQAKEYAESVIAASNAMIIGLNEQGEICVFNKAAEKITGYSAAELTGRNWFDVIVPRSRYPHVWQEFERLAAGGEPGVFENPILTKQGEERIISWQNAQLREDDKIIGMLSFGIDITERKKAEEANAQLYEQARRQNEELTALFSLSSRLRQAETVRDILPTALEEAERSLGANCGMILLYDQEHQQLACRAATGEWSPNEGRQVETGSGLLASALCGQEPRAIPDAKTIGEDMNCLHLPEDLGPLLLVPLWSGMENMGILVVARRREAGGRPFSPEECHLAMAIGEMVGTAIRRSLMAEIVQRQLTFTQALRDIDLAITASADVRVACCVVVDQVVVLLHVDAVSILLVNERAGTLGCVAARGFRSNWIQRLSLRVGEGVAGRAVVERKMIAIPDLRAASESLAEARLLAEEQFAAYYALPLIAKGSVKAVLQVFHRSPLLLSHEQTDFLFTLGLQAALAIDNGDLFERLQRSNVELVMAYDATLEAWAKVLDLRDRDTEGHTRRVTEMTVHLARALGMSNEELVHVRRGALLHDIGKMGVPDAILRKPGPLSEEDWQIMCQHPTLAYNLLSSISFLQPALAIPYCHHERWDGTGYPRGLKGEEIPLAARVFALADVWDALLSKRPYRDAWSLDEALQHVREQAGKHFDPRVVEVFFTTKAWQRDEST